MAHPLIEKFKDRAIFRGGVYTFTAADAVTVIEAAARKGYSVLGIDGFFLRPNATEPSLENSVDYSEGAQQHADTSRAAVDFVQQRARSGLQFEIILGNIKDAKFG